MRLAEQTFGKALGALILRKRRAAGLTQTQLAEDAYLTASKTRRISELESGKVDNPHAATIDPIITALKITERELEECAVYSQPREKDDLDDAYRNARNLIEAAARQFDHAQPEASLAELDEFLRLKASEWRALRDRIERTDRHDSEVDQLILQAREALDNGDFDKIDTLLSSAEERQQNEKTLAAIDKQSYIRISRGDAHFLNDQPEAALNDYRSAAKYYEPFDVERTIELIHKIAGNIYEVARRSMSPRFYVAAELLNDLSRIDAVCNDPHKLSVVNYRRSLVYRNESIYADREQSAELLAQATTYAREAVPTYDLDGCEYQAVCTRISLGNCLADQRGINGKQEILEAIDVFTVAKVIASESPDASPLLPHIYNSLGSAYLTLIRYEDEKESAQLRENALGFFSKATMSAETYFDLDVWGGAKINIARLLLRKSESDEASSKEKFFLQIRSIAEFEAALEAYPATAFPDRFVEAQIGLAGALHKHGRLHREDVAETYYLRSIQAIEFAMQFTSREKQPLRWADIHCRVGNVFMDHAALETTKNKRHDYTQAVKCYKAAAETFSEQNDTVAAMNCNDAILRVGEVAQEQNVVIEE